MKKALIVIVAVVFVLGGISLSAYAQTNAKEVKPAVATAAKPAAQPAAQPQKLPRANFAIITGSITKIDSTDPNNMKLEVLNEADSTTHTISVTPWTNVTKVTDITELKSGDTVRVMSRKMDDKEVAMGVMFGKIRKTTPPLPTPATPAAAPAQPQAKQ